MYRAAIKSQSLACRDTNPLLHTLGRALLVSVAAVLFFCSGAVSTSEHGLGRWQARQLHQTNTTAPSPPSPPSPLDATMETNVTSSLNGAAPSVDTTVINSNLTANDTILTNSTTSPPPPPETAKEKLQEKWEKMESGKSPAEKGIAITVGVLMLVCILTCLVCCVFRRGGQWRIPGLQWFKKKFGPKDKYSRYMDNNDDGF